MNIIHCLIMVNPSETISAVIFNEIFVKQMSIPNAVHAQRFFQCQSAGIDASASNKMKNGIGISNNNEPTKLRIGPYQLIRKSLWAGHNYGGEATVTILFVTWLKTISSHHTLILLCNILVFKESVGSKI